jgi:hypothetical protein
MVVDVARRVVCHCAGCRAMVLLLWESGAAVEEMTKGCKEAAGDGCCRVKRRRDGGETEELRAQKLWVELAAHLTHPTLPYRNQGR